MRVEVLSLSFLPRFVDAARWPAAQGRNQFLTLPSTYPSARDARLGNVLRFSPSGSVWVETQTYRFLSRLTALHLGSSCSVIALNVNKSHLCSAKDEAPATS
jgi:hypothetical protein